MRNSKSFITLLAGLLLSLPSSAGFVYEGFLTDLSGNPIANQNVYIRGEVSTPGQGCVLFQEFHYLSTNSSGYFSINVGTGTRVTGASYNADLAFNNGVQHTCVGGPGTLTPAAFASREMKVEVSYDNVTYDALGTVTLRAVPMALAAEMVGGYGINNIVRVTSGSAPAFNASQATSLIALVNGTSNLYVPANGGTTAVNLPTFSGNPASPSAGQIWYDSSSNQMKYYNGSTNVALTAGSAFSGVSSVGLNLPTSLFTNGAAVTSSGSLSATLANQAQNTVFAAPYTGGPGVPSFRVLDVLDIPALDSSKITSGTLAVARLGHGFTSAADGQLLIGNGAGFNLGTLIAGAGVTITNAPGAVTISASGGGGGTVTQVATGAGLTGGTFSTSGTISLATVGVTAGSFGSSNSVPVITVDTYGRITSAGSVAIAASPWLNNSSGIHFLAGSVGIGTSTPATSLDIAGSLRLGTEGGLCSGGLLGAIEFDGANLRYCDGGSWQNIAVAGSSISSLNGLSSTTQNFATGSAGTSPGWSSGSGTHTLNLPFASTASVTAGLLSHSDYVAFQSAGSIANSGTSASTANALVRRDGTGSFAANKGTFNSVDLNNGGSLLTLASPIGANYVMTLPSNIGSAGNVLSTDGSNQLSWISILQNGSNFLAGSGLAASPGFSFSADTNTGLFNPAADTLAFSTNGTEKMRIDASGNIGIGTTAPSVPLVISKGSATSGHFLLKDPDYALNATPFRAFIRAVDNSDASVWNLGIVSNSSQVVEFGANSGSHSLALKTNGAPRVFVTPVGNVGIGTTSPDSNLSVVGSLRSTSSSSSHTVTASATIDFSSGNFVTTTYDCNGGSFQISNLRDGGSYKILVTDTGTYQCNFPTTVTGLDAATINWKFVPANSSRTASTITLYELSRFGTNVIVKITGNIP